MSKEVKSLSKLQKKSQAIALHKFWHIELAFILRRVLYNRKLFIQYYL